MAVVAGDTHRYWQSGAWLPISMLTGTEDLNGSLTRRMLYAKSACALSRRGQDVQCDAWACRETLMMAARHAVCCAEGKAPSVTLAHAGRR